MGEIKWIKLNTNIFENKKIQYIRSLQNGDTFALIWIMLLSRAGECNADGKVFLTESVPYTSKMFASLYGVKKSAVEQAFALFDKLEMLHYDGEYIVLTGWNEHQNIDALEKMKEENRLRKQKSRNAKKERDKMCDKNVTGCDKMCDIDRDKSVTYRDCHAIEEEREEEGEEEYNSFNHSLLAAENEKEECNVTETASEAQRRNLLGGELCGGVVMLSDEQFDDLCDKLSLDELNRYIGIVRDCELNGKSYKRKTHYQAILDMARKDRRK